jgi:hypothetical protein
LLLVGADAAAIVIVADFVYGCLLLRSLWLIATDAVIVDEAAAAAAVSAEKSAAAAADCTLLLSLLFVAVGVSCSCC